jgi:hypothetical protein
MHSWLIVGVFFDRVGCWFGGCIRHVVIGFFFLVHDEFFGMDCLSSFHFYDWISAGLTVDNKSELSVWSCCCWLWRRLAGSFSCGRAVMSFGGGVSISNLVDCFLGLQTSSPQDGSCEQMG